MHFTKTSIPILLLCFFVISANAQPKKATADKIVAVVGDRIILQSEILNSLEDAKRTEQIVTPDANCILIEDAIISKVLTLQAEKDSLIIPDADVEAELDKRLRTILLQLGSEQEFERQFGKSMQRFKDDMRALWKDNMLAESMRQRLAGNVTITPAEVKIFFEKIPQDSLPLIPATVEVAQIVVYPKATIEMEQHIVAELNNYKRQIQSKAASFAQIAQRFSDDRQSKDRGGEYQVNRNETGWDPVFMNTVFRLTEGEISTPVKTQFGYHLILLVKRTGDDAIIRHILRVPPITEVDIYAAKAKLDSVRSKIISGTMSLNEAFKTYNMDAMSKFTGPFIINGDGSRNVTIDQLDRDLAATVASMNVGHYSQPLSFADQQGRQAIRIVFLKSRQIAHRLNMREDYVVISAEAIDQKRMQVLQKWVATNASTFFIKVDPEIATNCRNLARYASGD